MDRPAGISALVHYQSRMAESVRSLLHFAVRNFRHTLRGRNHSRVRPSCLHPRMRRRSICRPVVADRYKPDSDTASLRSLLPWILLIACGFWVHRLTHFSIMSAVWWCPNLIDLFNVSLSAGGAAEGSQGQVRSEAERAAPGSSTTRLRALKG